MYKHTMDLNAFAILHTTVLRCGCFPQTLPWDGPRTLSLEADHDDDDDDDERG